MLKNLKRVYTWSFFYVWSLLFQMSEDFSNDILDDVQSLINPNTKADNVLTWL